MNLKSVDQLKRRVDGMTQDADLEELTLLSSTAPLPVEIANRLIPAFHRRGEEIERLKAEHPFRLIQQMTTKEIEKEIGESKQWAGAMWCYGELLYTTFFMIFTEEDRANTQLLAAQRCLLCKRFLE